MIKTSKKEAAIKYKVTCTDESCRNILEFDYDDIGWHNNSVMGRTTKTTEGITCPDCRQIMGKELFEVVQ